MRMSSVSKIIVFLHGARSSTHVITGLAILLFSSVSAYQSFISLLFYTQPSVPLLVHGKLSSLV